MNSVAQRQPGLSQLTWATQFSSRSSAKVSASDSRQDRLRDHLWPCHVDRARALRDDADDHA